jgi:colicin import membrane protein
MDSEQFMTYFMNTKMAIIEEQNRKMLAEQAKIEQAKKELEQAQANEAQRIKDAENAKVNQRKLSLAQYHQFAYSESLKAMADVEFDILLENSKIAYNEKKQQELEKVRAEVLEKAQKDLAELEKVRVEALEKAQRDLAEQQRIKAEQEAKAKANAEAKEKLDQEKLEKEKKYKKWLKDNE